MKRRRDALSCRRFLKFFEKRTHFRNNKPIKCPCSVQVAEAKVSTSKLFYEIDKTYREFKD